MSKLLCGIAAMLLALSSAPAGMAAEAKWYPSGDLDKAIETARKLGRPIAVLQQDPKAKTAQHSSQRGSFKRAKGIEQFVCVMLDVNSGGWDPPYLAKLRTSAKNQGLMEKEGEFIPRLYLGTYDGEFLDVVPNGTSARATADALDAVLQKLGPLMPIPKAIAAWKNLDSARKFWKEEKYANAMALYMDIKVQEGKYPKMPLFEELKKDEWNINNKANEMLGQARQLLKDGKTDEARAMTQKVCSGFKGFDACKSANALMKEMPPPKDAAP